MGCSGCLDLVAALRIADGFQIGAGAKVATLAPEHSHLEGVISLKVAERLAQGVGSFAVDGVSFLRAGENNGQHMTAGLSVYGWGCHMASNELLLSGRFS